ncbi:mitotic spindle checkpoint protein BUB3, WD repeat superfamily [Suhomyces tanzawaensis NRRL Y-17324]|uniref:Mitotic spindle checkpoint protein BUB3, WD repeat superfamily n=1 Tax=Suhomyces tanzawaensis NRRL Y-17324 TaxID=984487 RepID=A0A1E4SKS2_9ASCO|nr:mitotic spindle checkpoint protein BUB3, WD repeat superfamily [Suhomyces tanzawaensis NRRL Y-17324]ODV80115.1 mitotic spindle checkpoint protein BUB3, WD repeat superfamily [Suhomyces tanzawaensis NRRL Y-17324]
MAVQLTQEELELTTNSILNPNFRFSPSEYRSNPSQSQSTPIEASHEYELNQSESLTVLYNLLYDDSSYLSKTDILSILNSLKNREDDLPFAITSLAESDLQGVKWPPGLKEKFYMDRSRVGNHNWFHNIPGSKGKATSDITIRSFKSNTDFFRFHKFFCKLKLHITHFQLRNLVCCGPNISNGIYYPLSYHHDHNLQTVQNTNIIGNHSSSNFDLNDDDYHTFFKINRLRPDNVPSATSDAMKLDCIIDSRDLLRNSNTRISTLTCTDNYLACGTFEGGYILSDVSQPDSSKLLGEFNVTQNSDGITNHMIINENNNELIVSSNDRTLRAIDLERNTTRNMVDLSFAINCASINTHNTNEVFITGDHLSSFIIDRRICRMNQQSSQEFKGHNDFGFSCDWSTKDQNYLITGNQDSCVRLWDRRKSDSSMYCWSGSLGSRAYSSGGPVRNCKFNYSGDYIAWAESLDHVGIVQLDDLLHAQDHIQSRIQSIDFIGKCTGLNFSPIENGNGEQLIVGVNDCPLGGILSYKLESREKSLDFDFSF